MTPSAYIRNTMEFNFDRTADHTKDASYRWQQPEGLTGVLGMDTADLDYDCAPCIREALVPLAQKNCYNYRRRTERYYRAVTGWYGERYGLSLRQEWLSDVPNTIGAVRMALGILTRPGDRVLVHTPCFGPLSRTIEGAGCLQVDTPLRIVNGRYEPDPEDFERKLREYRPSVFLLVNPHNPTCRVFTKAELQRMADLCAAHNVRIVSDEVHSLILYDGARHTPILAVSPAARQNSVQIVSLSKGYNLMGLPHAIVSIPDDAMRAEWNRQIGAFSFGYAVNAFSIEAVTAVLEGRAEGWMRALQTYLQTNRNALLRFFARESVPLQAFCPQSSFMMWVDCRSLGVPEGQLARYFMERARIRLCDGSEFGSEGSGFIRINYAVTKAVLDEAIARMERML